jgi:hypothetical protein
MHISKRTHAPKILQLGFVKTPIKKLLHALESASLKPSNKGPSWCSNIQAIADMGQLYEIGKQSLRKK